MSPIFLHSEQLQLTWLLPSSVVNVFSDDGDDVFFSLLAPAFFWGLAPFFLFARAVNTRMKTPVRPLRMTERYCWTTEVGNAAMIHVRPSISERWRVFFMIENTSSFFLMSLEVKWRILKLNENLTIISKVTYCVFFCVGGWSRPFSRWGWCWQQQQWQRGWTWQPWPQWRGSKPSFYTQSLSANTSWDNYLQLGYKSNSAIPPGQGKWQMSC